MRLLGFEVTRSSRVDQRIDMAVRLARVENIKTTITNNKEIRALIARQARAAAKDWIEQNAEKARDRFEADPQFQEWAAQRREHDLAAAELPADPLEDEVVHLTSGPQARPTRHAGKDGYEDSDSL